jgi:hypothetical protein
VAQTKKDHGKQSFDFSLLAASFLDEESDSSVEQSCAEELMDFKLLGACDLSDLSPNEVKADKLPAGQLEEVGVQFGHQLGQGDHEMNEILPAIENKIDRVFIGLQNAQAQAIFEFKFSCFQEMQKCKCLRSQQKTVEFLKGHSYQFAMRVEHFLWVVWDRG